MAAYVGLSERVQNVLTPAVDRRCPVVCGQFSFNNILSQYAFIAKFVP